MAQDLLEHFKVTHMVKNYLSPFREPEGYHHILKILVSQMFLSLVNY
jgi:hypothetical protein